MDVFDSKKIYLHLRVAAAGYISILILDRLLILTGSVTTEKEWHCALELLKACLKVPLKEAKGLSAFSRGCLDLALKGEETFPTSDRGYGSKSQPMPAITGTPKNTYPLISTGLEPLYQSDGTHL